MARGSVLCYAWTTGVILILNLLSSLLSNKEETASSSAKALGYVSHVSWFPLLATVLILVGVYKNSAVHLRGGIWLNCLSAVIWGLVLGYVLVICYALGGSASSDAAARVCIVYVIGYAIIVLWLVWGLRVSNAYYGELTGTGLLPCCGSVGGGPGMMGPGDVEMNPHPSAMQPSQGPAGSTAPGQPSGTLVAVNGPNGKFSSKTVQGFIIPLSTRQISSVFKPATGFGNPHDVAISRDGNDIFVVEITEPYKVWKFSGNASRSAAGRHFDTVQVHQQPGPSPSIALPHSVNEASPGAGIKKVADDSFGASVIIMAFLTIPLLLLIGIGSLMRLRDSGCCRRKETKSFSEFFPPSAGFEKLRMDETDSDNSDTEVEEYNASMYRKTSA